MKMYFITLKIEAAIEAQSKKHAMDIFASDYIPGLVNAAGCLELPEDSFSLIVDTGINEHNLKPCPFCGDTAKEEDGGFNHIRICCTNLNCRGSIRMKTREKAVTAWNKR